MLKAENRKVGAALAPRSVSRPKVDVLIVTMALWLTFTLAQAQPEDHAAPPTAVDNNFNLIKALAGDWEGTFEWLGTTRKGPINARYYLTGNGSAVVEDLISEGRPNMTTVYHLDGTDLRATHYCAAGNQPRLKATSASGKDNAVKFEMIDITNLTKPAAGHVRNLELRLSNPNDLTILFTFVASGKEAVEEIKLKRKT